MCFQRTSVSGLGVRDASVDPVLSTGDHLVTSYLSGGSGTRAALHAALQVSGTIAVVAGVRSSALSVTQGGLHAGSAAVSGLARSVVAALNIIVSRA